MSIFRNIWIPTHHRANHQNSWYSDFRIKRNIFFSLKSWNLILKYSRTIGLLRNPAESWMLLLFKENYSFLKTGICNLKVNTFLVEVNITFEVNGMTSINNASMSLLNWCALINHSHFLYCSHQKCHICRPSSTYTWMSYTSSQHQLP